MRKKVLIILVSCMLIFSLAGCGETKTISVNVENGNSLNGDILGVQSFVEIGSGLYYDSGTRIVYIYNRIYRGLVYTPYYAPNGFPYKYNPETNTFEEINFANE